MLKWIACVNWQATENSRFVTLTYPDSRADTNYRDRSIHRYLFLRSMENHLSVKVPALWRCEWIGRKSGEYEGYLMPHFHLLAFGVGYLPNDLVRTWWKQAIQHDGNVSTDVKAAPRDARLSYYVSKYAAKCTHLDIASYHNNMAATGRQWGVTRRDLVPMHPVRYTRNMNQEQIERAKVLGRATFPGYGEFGEGGFTMLGPERVALIKEKFADLLAK